MPHNDAKNGSKNVPRGTNGSDSCNTGLKQGKKPGTFEKNDPRINRKGRPRSFDAVRELALAIANETEANKKTAIENVLRSWRNSPEPTLQKAFVEYGYGKVPDKIEATGLENKTVLQLFYDHERPESLNRN